MLSKKQLETLSKQRLDSASALFTDKGKLNELMLGEEYITTYLLAKLQLELREKEAEIAALQKSTKLFMEHHKKIIQQQKEEICEHEQLTQQAQCDEEKMKKRKFHYKALYKMKKGEVEVEQNANKRLKKEVEKLKSELLEKNDWVFD